MRAALDEFQFPVVIKGDTGEAGETVRIVWDRHDVLRTYRAVRALESRAESRPAIQEFIQGDSYSVGGLYHRGWPLRVVAHRKLVRYPHPYGGKTVRGITEHSPGLLREAFKIFEALQYSGLGHVEFVRDHRDGTLKFLEINARPWGTIGVAEDAGVDLFTPYRKLVRGEHVAPDLSYQSGLVFHRMRREIRLMRSRPRRVLGFIRDVLDPRVRSDFRWSDPGPHMPFAPPLSRPPRPRIPPIEGTPRLAV
jgi:predicted ATP-grasp superfamily ATP-dependent carboligase